MVVFVLATGLRQGNVTGLCWSQVEIGRRTAWVHGYDANSSEDLHVSLNDLAMDAAPAQQASGARLHL